MTTDTVLTSDPVQAAVLHVIDSALSSNHPSKTPNSTTNFQGEEHDTQV